MSRTKLYRVKSREFLAVVGRSDGDSLDCAHVRISASVVFMRWVMAHHLICNAADAPLLQRGIVDRRLRSTMSPDEQQSRPPSISRRISLRFLPDPPSELTSTLVLNAGGGTNLYTDFRPFLREPTACEWAFAGAKEYLSGDRCQWSHVVDNRAKPGDEPAAPDVGHCETLPNGDELETGEMVNPATGRVEAYEEVWRDKTLAPGTKVVAVQLKRKDTEAVLGIFVQVGDWAQIVTKTENEDVAARRWYFDRSWRLVSSYGWNTKWMPPLDGSIVHDTSALIPPADDLPITWFVAENFTWTA